MTAAIPNPPLTPSDGRGGLLPLAEQLAQAIDLKWGAAAPVALVGFSMGGLISAIPACSGIRNCWQISRRDSKAASEAIPQPRWLAARTVAPRRRRSQPYRDRPGFRAPSRRGRRSY